MKYLISVPSILKSLYPKGIWEKDSAAVYLTFDDGPHLEITSFVLDELKKYQAKATFFCVGNNVGKYPEVYQRILAEGHQIGNHTFSHKNGWKTAKEEYLKDVEEAAELIDSKLFRPPYGKIKRGQAEGLSEKGFQIVYWSLLSGDFDLDLSPEKCWENVLKNIKPGSIVVFHDSEKAWERLKFVLPKTLEYCRKQGWDLKSL